MVISGCGRADREEPTSANARDLIESRGKSTHEFGIGGGSSAPEEDDSTGISVPTRFRDVTAESAIDFVYRNGEEAGHFAILESLGGGLAAFDYDRDGWLDLFATGGGEFTGDKQLTGLPSALFRNLGDWRFANVTQPAQVGSGRYYSHGAAAADWDNDGFDDVLVTGYGGLVLWHNRGDGTFVEVAQPAGLRDTLWSSSAAWGDLNGDGHLDLYIAHYVDWSFENDPFCAGPKPGLREICPPRSYQPLPDTVYYSGGDGTFRDATSEAGLRPDGKGLGVVISDLDLDGDADIYVANDTVNNFLYRNDGRGRFEEIGMFSGTSVNDSGLPDGSMGVDVGDFNLDGLPDLWVANYERESFGLYRNEGDCLFRSVSRSTGVTAIGGLYVGWGTLFSDFDRDGDEDLFISNGHVIRYPQNAPLRQRPLLLDNQNGTWFENVTEQVGDYMRSAHMGRGVVGGDFDNDGRVDLAVSHTNEPLAVLANETADEHASLRLELIGRATNRSAIGGLVRVVAGGREFARQIKGGSSYASTSDARLIFGLAHSKTVEEVVIRWPTGSEQRLENIGVDQFLRIVEPLADTEPATRESSTAAAVEEELYSRERQAE